MNMQPSIEMELSVHTILVRARVLIFDPARFCQGRLAQNGAGDAVDARSKHAACWCAYGAIERIAGGRGRAYRVAIAYLRAACKRRFGTRLMATEVADLENGHARILEVFTLAIEDVSVTAVAR